jgi:hypothetical protein
MLNMATMRDTHGDGAKRGSRGESVLFAPNEDVQARHVIVARDFDEGKRKASSKGLPYGPIVADRGSCRGCEEVGFLTPSSFS